MPYRPPYHWAAMLAFLAARAVPATERVEGGVYQRTMRLGPGGDSPAGTVTVSHEAHAQALRVQLSSGLAGKATEVVARIRQLFDIHCDPQVILDRLGDLAQPDPGLRLPGAVDPFEIAVRAILGQQITVAAARTLAVRFVARFGMPLAAPLSGRSADDALLPTPEQPRAVPALSHLFPLPETIALLDAGQLGEIGIIRARGQAIIDVARSLVSGTLPLLAGAGRFGAKAATGRGGCVEPTLTALTAIRGIGPWTAHYVAMRSLGWADAFPPGDVVVLKALQVKTPAAAAVLAERWRPWRAYAVLHLWRRMAVSAR